MNESRAVWPIHAEGLRSSDLARGVVAMMPLLPGVAIFSMTMAVLAREAGLTVGETVGSSLIIFAGSAQLAMASLIQDGTANWLIVLTAVSLNLRHVLFGWSLATRLDRTSPSPGLIAALLTDESYGVAMTEKRRQRAIDAGRVAVGAGLTLYVMHGVGTFAGAVLGDRLPDSDRLGLELIFPMTFLTMLLPSLTHRPAVIAALVAGATAVVMTSLGGGLAVLLAMISGATAAATLPPAARQR